MTDPFRGPHLTLRAFEPEDAEALAGYLNHPDLIGRRQIPWRFSDVTPLSRRQIQAVLESWAGEEKGLPLAIVRAEDGRLIGHAECSWEWDPISAGLSVVIDPAFQRQGYGSEALSLLVRYLFEWTPANAVQCWITGWNEPALRFAARHGFQANGVMRWAGLRQGRPYDTVVADLLRAEWQGKGGTADAA